MSFWKDLTTGKDNNTHDVVRFAISIMTMLFPAIIVWLMIMVSIAFFMNRPFDLVATSEGIAAIFVSFGTFLMQGGGSLYFKRSTEPDGTQTTVESIKSGDAARPPQTEVTRVTQTNIQG